MSRETLIAELNRLLDVGEPLLTVFPRKHPDYWVLAIPGNISPEMLWYANHVSSRADDRGRYQGFRRRDTFDTLTAWVSDFEAGLLGWRAIGVLK